MSLTDEQLTKLQEPLPNEAVNPHPTKPYLSSIKAIYVTERFNDVFGVGKWSADAKIIDPNDGAPVVYVTFTVPEHDIVLSQFGGNDNGGTGAKNYDLGDAYKGAMTDAITKIGSYLGIGSDVFKGLHGKPKPQTNGTPSKPKTQSKPKATPKKQEPKPSTNNNGSVDTVLANITEKTELIDWWKERMAEDNAVEFRKENQEKVFKRLEELKKEN
ncbi:MAG TPA: hypothetical protein VLA13_05085 [Massilibacterium sp.]|nr:hypothetical protein [Massilibacterium sp.]